MDKPKRQPGDTDEQQQAPGTERKDEELEEPVGDPPPDDDAKRKLQRENQKKMGVLPNHKTEDMEKGRRGTAP